MKPKAYIFDIDGTLADCSHRLHHITGEKKDFDAFYAACKGDMPIEHVLNLCKKLGEDHTILYVTGRPVRTIYNTKSWLLINGLPFYGHLYMRKDGDRRHDYVVKREIYEHEIKDKYEVLGVFEDRQQCVDMWRELGLACFQVAKGNY